MAKKKGKKLRLRGLVLLLLLFYVIGMSIYYIFTMPVKNVIIKGNKYISESEIISSLDLDKKAPLYKVNTANLKKNLEKHQLINKIKLNKSIFGDLTIIIEEYKPLYYNVLTKKVMFSSSNEIDGDFIIGLPTLVNYIPSKEAKEFVKKLSLVDEDVIKMISEIEYDGDRYILRMNDNNIIYINVRTIEKLNKYPTIYEKFGNGKIIDLDSVDSESNKFIIKNQ